MYITAYETDRVYQQGTCEENAGIIMLNIVQMKGTLELITLDMIHYNSLSEIVKLN